MKKNVFKGVMFTLFVGLLLLSNSTEVYAADKETLINAWNAFILEYRIIMAWIAGMGALTSVLIFIFHMVQLGNLSSHPIKRREAMMNLMISMICTALLGGLGVITGLFYQIMLI
ncbi:hypothetical protein [Paenibacillus polymyxa]|uniref:Uncharacterized protein n=1 Tax=Paenibacillus polymyxa (strain SC2) TaxID=886882 RepID=E3EKR8_PAEPS|nr:hypothetical protein [Paenibacillus polymyxa]ADO59519.1 hypothetical protein PPSC2_27505 [Paenibacillus polymyxa SC2]WPQ59649.1 hypothetical protein SKN87_28725 [Paenibacillus polymyxa]